MTVLIILGSGSYLLLRSRTGSYAEDANPDCTLIVPPQPLSAQGLATPYRLVATDDDNGPCNEANMMQSAFVQAAVIDPATGKISIYDPLVVDKGTRPAIPPVVPQLPAGGVVGIWFGFNGAHLTLKGTDNSLQAGNCVNKVHGTVFGQVAFCNATAFFAAANQAIRAGKLVPPALGVGQDGQTCPSVRDFSVVDQDQSDNVTTAYFVNEDGKTAQVTAANVRKFQGARVITNASDNRLIAIAVDNALECQPWMAPDLANPGHMTTAEPLNELQAAAHPANPTAIVPAGDPMVLVDNHPNLDKLNAYRLGVDQPVVQSLAQASTRTYCSNLLAIAPQRIFLDAPFTRQQPSPDPAAANSLFTFLAQRFNMTWGADGLNCQKLLDTPSPIRLKQNDDGVVVNATLRQHNKGDGYCDNGQSCNDNSKHNDNGQSCTSQYKEHHGSNQCSASNQKNQQGQDNSQVQPRMPVIDNPQGHDETPTSSGK